MKPYLHIPLSDIDNWHTLVVINTSTSSMTRKDDELFHRITADPILNAGAFPFTVVKQDYGWEISLTSLRDEMVVKKLSVAVHTFGMSDLLRNNLTIALDSRATHIRFDRDAIANPLLPYTSHWPDHFEPAVPGIVAAAPPPTEPNIDDDDFPL